MSSFKSLTARECAERLLLIDNPVIFIHVRPDGDAVGSAAALAEVFSQLGKSAPIMCDGNIPERLKFVLEHTGATVTEDRGSRTAVSIDVPAAAQLGSLKDTGDMPALMIDHHASGSPFADGYVVADLSSAGEVLYRVILELIDMGKAELNEKLAYALYTSISSDTGRFSYSAATPETYRIAARLMECGIDWASINHKLFSSKPPQQIKAEGIVASRAVLDGRISYATLTLRERESAGLLEEHLETAIEIVRSISGAETSFFLRETAEGVYKASLRSTRKNVARVAAKFNGGGHILAAGCTLYGDSIERAAEELLHALKSAEDAK